MLRRRPDIGAYMIQGNPKEPADAEGCINRDTAAPPAADRAVADADQSGELDSTTGAEDEIFDAKHGLSVEDLDATGQAGSDAASEKDPPPLPADATLGMRLRWLRQCRGQYVAETAGDLGLSRTTVSTWERDGSEPNVEWLVTLARYYGVSVDWLTSGEGVPALPPQTPDEAEMLSLFRRVRRRNARQELLSRGKDLAHTIEARGDWVTRPWTILQAGSKGKRRETAAANRSSDPNGDLSAPAGPAAPLRKRGRPRRN